MIALYVFIGLLVVFCAVVLVRTAAFRPREHQKAQPVDVKLDEHKAVDDLAAMIRCRTVSNYDRAKQDEKEFDKFRALLPKLYPHIFKACSYERVGDSGLLFKWPGKSDAEPTVLMAHYDVVPVNEEHWDKPAFDGIIENGELWGRGTLDTKGTLCGVLEAAENLISQGFAPADDIYFAFAGDEEVAGEGAKSIVAEFKRRGVVPALVVDEGGAVVEGVFPGVSESCALVGIGEKGLMDVEFKVLSAGGHASAPPAHTPVGVLAAAAVKLESTPFKSHLTPPVAEMFDTLGRRSSFGYRMIFANLWCFGWLLDAICKKRGGELNALMRTTVALTQAEGSKASNVLPPSARLVANLRLMGGDTTESALEYLRGVVGDDSVEVNMIMGENPSTYSRTDSKGWQDLAAAIEQTWPEAVVSPYLMIAASDSRHYSGLSENVMRFSAMALSGAERGMIHANNERISTEKIVETVRFYMRLILRR